MTSDLYRDHFNDILARLADVVGNKWPETLDGNSYNYVQETQPDLMIAHNKLTDEVHSLWVNRANFDDFKTACSNWGRSCLQIHQAYATGLKRREAA